MPLSYEILFNLPAHAREAYVNYYSKEYASPSTNFCVEGIPRPYHGIQHACRVALWAKAWANLYQKYGQDDFKYQYTDEEIALIQIAGLFHDSAREDDETDFWDKGSAQNLYNYLYKIGVSSEQAKILAEGIANKDIHEDKVFQELKLNDAHQILGWEKCEFTSEKKNSHKKFIDPIQNADCVDIIRARDEFDGTYLNFYKNVAGNNPEAYQEMALFISAARALIASHGEARDEPLFPYNIKIRKEFELADCYEKVMAGIANDPRMEILNSYIGNKSTYSLNEEQKILQKELIKGKLLLRGIVSPVQLAEKKQDETWGELELRKDFRTKDNNTNQKEGNFYRSTVLAGYGTPPFSPVGLFITLNLQRIIEVSLHDNDSGIGKKRDFDVATLKNLAPLESKIEKLIKSAQIKVSYRQHKDRKQQRKIISYHNEIITHIRLEDIKGIYFSKTTKVLIKGKLPTIAVLESIYLKQAAEKKYGRILPIFEYDTNGNFINGPIKIENEEVILSYWKQVFDEHLIFSINSLIPLNVNTFKTYYQLHKIDNYYSKSLQYKVEVFIDETMAEKKKEFHDFLRNKTKFIDEKGVLYPNTVYLILFYYPDLKDKACEVIQEFLNCNVDNWRDKDLFFYIMNLYQLYDIKDFDKEKFKAILKENLFWCEPSPQDLLLYFKTFIKVYLLEEISLENKIFFYKKLLGYFSHRKDPQILMTFYTTLNEYVPLTLELINLVEKKPSKNRIKLLELMGDEEAKAKALQEHIESSLLALKTEKKLFNFQTELDGLSFKVIEEYQSEIVSAVSHFFESKNAYCYEVEFLKKCLGEEIFNKIWDKHGEKISKEYYAPRRGNPVKFSGLEEVIRYYDCREGKELFSPSLEAYQGLDNFFNQESTLLLCSLDENYKRARKKFENLLFKYPCDETYHFISQKLLQSSETCLGNIQLERTENENVLSDFLRVFEALDKKSNAFLIKHTMIGLGGNLNAQKDILFLWKSLVKNAEEISQTTTLFHLLSQNNFSQVAVSILSLWFEKLNSNSRKNYLSIFVEKLSELTADQLTPEYINKEVISLFQSSVQIKLSTHYSLFKQESQLVETDNDKKLEKWISF